jgi:hypothetical protein
MRPTYRALTAGLTALSLLGLGLTIEQSAGAVTGTLPSAVNEVVSINGTLTDGGCPASLSTTFNSAPAYTTIAAAITAATAGNTIYVCAGNFNLTTGYGSNDQVVVNKSLTLDGLNWDVAPSPSDTTSASVNGSTQSEISEGSGILVQSNTVTIQGFTFYQNNGLGGDTNAESIDVQSNISGSGDQGYSHILINDNLFVDTGGNAPLQNGDVHFGLGMDAAASGTGSPADVNFLDTNDEVENNVFSVDAGFENNAVQLSDTTGAIVTGNTVNYPTSDDNSLSALWFPGFDQALTVSNNTLIGGGIDSDGTVPDTSDPKSGIKVVDEDPSDTYGDGCSAQTITGNTISGFVYGISMISQDVDVDSHALCASGPSAFSVTTNNISSSAVYGIYVSLAAGVTGATVTGNTVTTDDAAGQPSLGYPAGDYPYFDNSATFSGDTWSGNTPSSVVRPQTITWTPPGSQTWVSGGAGTFSLGSSSDTAATTVTFASSTTSVCTVSGTTVTMLTPGTCTITPTAPGTSTYAITVGSPSNITINGTTQTITWTPPGAQTWVTGGAGTFSLGAASDTSGSTVTFASSTTSVCTVSGTTVTMLTPGTCTITPTAPASGNYSTTVGSPSNITINDASQTITWTAPGSQTWVTGGAGTFSLGAASDTSGSTVTFASSTTSVCTVSGTTVTMLTPGTCTITPTAPASGNYSTTVGSPSNININASGGGGGGGGTTTTTTTTTTTPPPPVTTTTIPTRSSVSLSGVQHTGNDVTVDVKCSTARCAGIAELTKTITVKVEIGHTGKYRTVSENVLLGRVSYARAAGSNGQVKIQLSAIGLKLIRAADGHRFACVLTVTSSGGPKRETVSLTT